MGRRLRALEAAVGHTLFQRTGEGFVLTDEGASVLGHAERIEEEVLAVQRQLAGSEAELEGLLRLSSSDWFGTFMLAPVLADFSRRHPRVCLELLTDARLYSLPRREADLVFRIRPFDEPEVISRRLMHIAYALYAPAGSAMAFQPGDGAGLTGDHDGHRLCRDARRGLAQAGAAERRRHLPQQQPRGAGPALCRGVPAWPFCRARSATRRPASWRSRWMIRRRVGTPLSAIIAICVA